MLLRTTRGDPARVLSNSLQTQGIEVPPWGGGRGNNAGALVAGKPTQVMLPTGLFWPMEWELVFGRNAHSSVCPVG